MNHRGESEHCLRMKRQKADKNWNIQSNMVRLKQKVQRQIIISRSATDGIISYSKALHPNEAILILQGKTTQEQVFIEGLVIPPFASSGPYYSGYSNFYLPSDASYVGSAHSHPGGSN
ncbi:MAG TPA: hypothetical protein VE264_06985, partial [Nitrososphaera sp.]|nr:hypothetical protein [Nitrososphaera sp.]